MHLQIFCGPSGHWRSDGKGHFEGFPNQRIRGKERCRRSEQPFPICSEVMQLRALEIVDGFDKALLARRGRHSKNPTTPEASAVFISPTRALTWSAVSHTSKSPTVLTLSVGDSLRFWIQRRTLPTVVPRLPLALSITTYAKSLECALGRHR